MIESKYKKALALAATAKTIYETSSALYEKYQEHQKNKSDKEIYAISVSERTDAYFFACFSMIVAEFLSEGATERKNFLEFSARSDQRLIFVPSLSNSAFMFEGSLVTVERTVESPVKGSMSRDQKLLVLKFRTYEAREKFIKLASSEFEKLFLVADRNPSNWIRSFDGYEWDRVRKIKKTKDSVFLSDGKLEKIIDHVKKFDESEELYMKIGSGWSTGVCLYGPAGTGKSSMAEVIASETKRDICLLNLDAISGDQTWGKLLSSVPERAIVLIEDIDTFKVSNDRDEVKSEGSKNISLSGLLNFLDGGMTPHGAIFVITTNKIDVLDEAVIRPGRIDLSVELGYVNSAQVEDIIFGISGVRTTVASCRDKVSPAEVMKIFRSHIDNLEAAIPEILEFVS